jgi:hypothetical protein
MSGEPEGGAEGAPEPADAGEGDGAPQLTDSEGYLDDSERYREEEDYPWLREEQPESGDDGELGADWMPDAALAGALEDPDGLESNRREWQVNIRLDRPRYAMLKRAADVYGTTPTALARMLLNRGATAILNAHRAEMTAFEWADPRG